MGVINKKVGSFSVGEAFAVGLAKPISEQLITPILGNGNIVSGGAKMLSAYLLPKMFGSNKITSVIATAMAVDGVEDMVTTVFSGGIVGQQAESRYL